MNSILPLVKEEGVQSVYPDRHSTRFRNLASYIGFGETLKCTQRGIERRMPALTRRDKTRAPCIAELTEADDIPKTVKN